MINKNSKIFVAGHNGLVGSAIVRKLKEKGFRNILTISRSKLDLTNEQKVFNFLRKKKPKFILTGGKIGFGSLDFRYPYIHSFLTEKYYVFDESDDWKILKKISSD